jgi:hypothetical protein
MTVAVAANLREGVIFGVDSATTCSLGPSPFTSPIQKIYDGAQKIFHIGHDDDTYKSPYAAVIFGAAIYGNNSWRNVFATFWRSQPFLSGITDAESWINAFKQHLLSLIPNQSDRPQSGMFIAGFEPSDKNVRLFRIDVNTLNYQEIPQDQVVSDGFPFVVQRLTSPLDNPTRDEIKNLNSYNIPVNTPAGVMNRPLGDLVIEIISQKANGLYCPPDKNMPLRDGIDYVNFLVYSTIKTFKFTQAPICGGGIELAAITLDRGFRRIKTKPLDIQIYTGGDAWTKSMKRQ